MKKEREWEGDEKKFSWKGADKWFLALVLRFTHARRKNV